jgi:hypothetical protein
LVIDSVLLNIQRVVRERESRVAVTTRYVKARCHEILDDIYIVLVSLISFFFLFLSLFLSVTETWGSLC